MSADVSATLVDDIDQLRARRVAGAFNYVPDAIAPTGMRFICPCGCGRESFMAFAGTEQPGRTWDWDRDREHPTLSPSVFNSGMPCQWHGFLVAGVWKSC